ncbi:MAG: hypothetical protein AAF725_18885 [Acidobacteriota bacterium]
MTQITPSKSIPRKNADDEIRSPYVGPLAFALLLLILILATPAEGAKPSMGFLTSLEEPAGGGLEVLARDGRVLRGSIHSSMTVRGSMTRLTLKLEDGSRVRLKAREIDRVVMPLDDFWRGVLLKETTTTFEEIWKGDFERIYEVDELIFDSVRNPGSSRFGLRQLVNPGFDARLRVYDLAAKKEREGQLLVVASKSVFGDMPKAFLVVKDGGEAVRVRQRSYRAEQFEQLYGDCPAMLERFEGKARKFKHFAEHVFVYDRTCPGHLSPPS